MMNALGLFVSKTMRSERKKEIEDLRFQKFRDISEIFIVIKSRVVVGVRSTVAAHG